MKLNGFLVAQQDFGEGVARICRLYGVSPLAGRLYTRLYMSARPVSLDDLCKRVGAAKSSVSVALRKLLAARVVERLAPQGDRRDYYLAITDPWAVLADWNRLYFAPELRMFRDTGEAIERALDHAADAPTGADADALRARVTSMRSFHDVFRRFIGDLVESQPAPEPARHIPIAIDEEPPP